MAKIRIHGCGGAGIKISNDLLKSISSMGIISEVTRHSFDTTTATDPNAYLVKMQSIATGARIDGSGGEASTHAAAIKLAVKEYLTDMGMIAPVKDEYHIICYSASGGTGRTISPLLSAQMLALGIPHINVVVGDSGDQLKNSNTIKTIKSLDGISKINNKCVNVVYINNNSVSAADIKHKEIAVNKILANTLCAISLIINGGEDLDNQDINNFLIPTNYKSINIPIGVYTILVGSGETTMVAPANTSFVLARTITTDKAGTINADLLHQKVGKVSNNSPAAAIFGEQFPVHMVSVANYMVAELKSLNEIDKKYEESINNIKTQALAGETDSDGLVF